MINKTQVLSKIIGMFRPYDGTEFLGHKGSETICGPTDRTVVGMDTNFPKQWLVEDFGFTPEEADWFIAEVGRMNDQRKAERGYT